MIKAKKAPIFVQARLESIEERLLALIDPDSGVAIAPEIKFAVKNYLEAWVIPHVRIAKEWAKGEHVPTWWKGKVE